MSESSSSPPADRAGATQFLNRLYRYKTVLKKRWWILLITLVVAVGAQLYRALQTPLTFASYSQMIIGGTINVNPNATYTEEPNNFVGTQIALMRGNLINERIRESLRTNQPNLKPCPVILDIDMVPKTSIFFLQAKGVDPKYTQAYLNACMQEYINYRREMRVGTTDSTIKALEQETVEVSRELETRRAELQEFQKTNVVGSLAEMAANDSKFLTDQTSQLRQLQTEFEVLKALDNDLPSGTSFQQRNLPSNADRESAQRMIAQKKAEREKAALVWKEKHPKMIELTEEIVRAENLLNIYNQQSLEEIARQRNSLQRQIAIREKTIEQLKKQSLESSLRLSDYEDLRRRHQYVQNKLDGTQKTLDALKATKAADIAPNENIKIHEWASAAKSDNTTLAKNVAIGCFIGLVFGIGLLFLLDRFDDRPLSFSELQDQFEELILGQIPQDGTRNPKARIQPLTPNDTRYAYAEAYRNLRSSLIFMAVDGARPRTIVVTSAIPGEGKSTVAANLAITMAQSGSRVLLADADLRKGLSHDLFNLQESPGLAEILGQDLPWKNAIQTTAVPNLSFLARGNHPMNPGELLLSKGPAFLREVYESFDFVLIDSAPVLAADDTASLSPKADGVLFVVRAGYTSARLARNALEVLYQRQVNVLGLVFNSIETNNREYYYFKYPEYYRSSSVAQK